MVTARKFIMLVWLLAMLPCIFASCSNTKPVQTVSEWKGDKIEFGYGGGFAGTSILSVLLSNGQLFTKQGYTEDFRFVKTIDKQAAKGLFSLASKAEWPSAAISEPGNTYTVLNYETKQKRIELTWGNGKFTPNESLSTLYKKLLSLQ